MILYTSGTTGKPKGAELTHDNLFKNCTVAASTLGEITDEDKLLGALPLFHSFGQTCTLNAGICNRAMISMIPRFDPDKALEIIARDGITIFQGVPTMYNAMLPAESADSADTSTLRLCMSGGAAMPEEVMRKFEDKFGCKVLEGYGLSETSPVASFNHPDKERKPGSIGTPIDGVEMKVVDDDGNEVDQGELGEIVIKGHNVMKGYWNRDGGDGRGDQGRLVPLRRHRQGRRGRLLLHRRPQEGPDHPRRLQRLPARDRGGALRASGDPGGRGDRHPHDELGEEVGAAVVLKTARTSTPTPSSSTSRTRWRPTSTRARCGSWTSCPRARPGKILKREIEAPAEAKAEA